MGKQNASIMHSSTSKHTYPHIRWVWRVTVFAPMTPRYYSKLRVSPSLQIPDCFRHKCVVCIIRARQCHKCCTYYSSSVLHITLGRSMMLCIRIDAVNNNQIARSSEGKNFSNISCTPTNSFKRIITMVGLLELRTWHQTCQVMSKRTRTCNRVRQPTKTPQNPPKKEKRMHKYS